MSENDNLDPLEKHLKHLAYPDPARRRLVKFFRSVDKTPQEMLDMQKQASLSTDDVERNKVANMVKEFVLSKKGQRNSKRTEFSVINSFFTNSYRQLPKIPYLGKSLKSDRPLVSGKIMAETLRIILTALRNDPRRASMILVQFSGFMGVKELMLVNENYGYEIGEKLKKGTAPIEIEMKWHRKENEDPYHTFISKTACAALREYFEGPRGYPKPQEPVWYAERCVKGQEKKNRKREPLTALGYRQMWMRLTAKLGFRPSYYGRKSAPNAPRETWRRYGTGPHELRDLGISLSQRAIAKDFNPESAEYFAGHMVDALGYRKLHSMEAEYRLEQYQIVEPYLDVMRNGVPEEVKQNMQQQSQQIEQLQKVLKNRLLSDLNEAWRQTGSDLQQDIGDDDRKKTMAAFEKERSGILAQLKTLGATDAEISQVESGFTKKEK